MEHLSAKLHSSPLRGYFTFGLALLLLAAAIVAIMGTAGCGDDQPFSFYSSPDSHKVSSPAPGVAARMIGGPSFAYPGSSAYRVLSCEINTSPPPAQVRFTWLPPEGATNLNFDPPPAPGGPPYVWDNRPPDQQINVQFNHGPLPEGSDSWNTADVLFVGPAGGEGEHGVTFVTHITQPGRRAPASAARSGGQVQSRSAQPAAPEARMAWEANRWSWSTDITVTTEVCQDWAAFVQRDDVFAAIRLPVATVAPTQAYSIPLVLSGHDPHYIYLAGENWDEPLVSATLEIRPERQDFAENLLPASPGQHWVALGVSDEPIVCPDGMSLTPDNWVIRTRTLLDLSDQANDCAGCEIATYYCYEGQDPPSPGALAAAARALDEGAGVSGFQDWGITCLGPIYSVLWEPAAKQWDLHGTSVVYVTPTVTSTVAVRHLLFESVAGPLSIDLEHSSNLPAAWQLYGGTWNAPDLGTPLVPPLDVNASRIVWLVAPVPVDTASGLYTLFITATAAALPPTQRASDGIWVGDWVAPPLPPGAGFRVYLPVVVRNY